MDNLAAKALAYRRERMAHWDRVAAWHGRLGGFRNQYHRLLEHQIRQIVPPGMRVLELGCGLGDLLAALKPELGVGVDFSGAMVQRAAQDHPGLRFVQADAHALPFEFQFDYIILSDLVNDLWDVQAVLAQVARVAGSHTRIIINAYSRLWQAPLGLARWLALKVPDLEQNWLTVEDLANLLDLAECELIKHERAVLLPMRLPLLAPIANRVLVKLWPFSWLALTNFMVARPRSRRQAGHTARPSASVIVPARNEAGNIASIFERTPELGRGTELVFVEGHSRDETYDRIREEIERHPGRQAGLLKQPGIGKADAVWAGFAAAHGDVLMILDADLSVPPEDLKRFYDTLVSGQAEFVNGVRLVYPMENRAMRTLNLAGNKFFGMAFSWLLGQPVKDTLCGTKVLWRRDFERIQDYWPGFGEQDPFGDFDLLFGAAKLCLKIVDMPIRYKERVYGETNIDRWRHGLILLRMLGLAARRLKFV